MSDAARDSYIAGIDPVYAPVVRELDRTIMAAGPELESRIAYNILMYGIKGDFRHWVCAIDVGRPKKDPSVRPVHVRFLFGNLLDDPRGVLRSGTATLKTIDFASIDEVDLQLVADYVADALARFEEFKAESGAR